MVERNPFRYTHLVQTMPSLIQRLLLDIKTVDPPSLSYRPCQKQGVMAVTNSGINGDITGSKHFGNALVGALDERGSIHFYNQGLLIAESHNIRLRG